MNCGQPLGEPLQPGECRVDCETAQMLRSVVEKLPPPDMVPGRDGRVDTCHCPHKPGGFILLLHDGSPLSHPIRAMGQPVIAGPPAKSPGPGVPPLGEPSCAHSNAWGDLPHMPATVQEASDTGPALVSHPVPSRRRKPVLRTVLLRPPIPSIGSAWKTGRGLRSLSRAMTPSRKPEPPRPLPRPPKMTTTHLNRGYIRDTSRRAMVASAPGSIVTGRPVGRGTAVVKASRGTPAVVTL